MLMKALCNTTTRCVAVSSRLRPRRVYVSIFVGWTCATWAMGWRAGIKLDWLTVLLAATGLVVGSLAHAWWLDKYEHAIIRGDSEL